MANYREDNINIDNDIDDEIMRRVIEESMNHTHGKYTYGENVDDNIDDDVVENDEEFNRAILESEKINVKQLHQQNYDSNTIFKQNDDVLKSMISKFNILKHSNIVDSQPAQPVQLAELVQPAELAEPVQPAELAEPVQPAELAEPVQHAQPTQPAQNTITDTKLTLEQLREQRLKYFTKK